MIVIDPIMYLGEEKLHICRNFCHIFEGAEEQCPVCQACRFEGKTCQPSKAMLYFSLTERLKRLWETSPLWVKSVTDVERRSGSVHGRQFLLFKSQQILL